MKITNIDEIDQLRILYDCQFLGPFPEGEALLVPVATAISEIKLKFPLITPNLLKSMLKKRNILVFSDVEDYARFKGITKRKRR